MARVMQHHTLIELQAGGLPTINGLSDLLHPTQALCDMMTVREKLGGWQGRTLAYVGGANNMLNSLMLAGCTLGLHVRAVCPPTRSSSPCVPSAGHGLVPGRPREHLRVGEHGHEIGVAVPTGDDVPVEVVGQARAGGPALVQPDVVTLGAEHPITGTPDEWRWSCVPADGREYPTDPN